MNYYPIVRSKAGELDALYLLSPQVKVLIAPIIQILPAPEGKVGYLGDLVKKMAVKLKDFPTVYIDTCYAWKDAGLCDNIFPALSEAGVNAKPVLRLYTAVERLAFLKQNGFLEDNVCIRVTSEYATSENINFFYEALASNYNISKSQSELLIDFEYVATTNLTHYVNSFVSLYQSINDVSTVKSIIVGAGSFPKDVSNINAGEIGLLERYDLQLFNRIRAATNIPNIAFADYCNLHPMYEESTEVFLGSCTIKYTGPQEFIIFRGKRASNHPQGNRQYVYKSKELIEKAYYSGPAFSSGDKAIFDCASEIINSGNAQKWVTYTVNHHITLMAQYPY